MISSGLSFVGCERRNDYDDGYEAAWNGEDEPSSWSSREKKNGYQEGVEDSCLYDEGYHDGLKGKKPKYFNDTIYMEGYKDGKEDRRR